MEETNNIHDNISQEYNSREYNHQEYNMREYNLQDCDLRESGLEFGKSVAASFIGSILATAAAVCLSIYLTRKNKGGFIKNITDAFKALNKGDSNARLNNYGTVEDGDDIIDVDADLDTNAAVVMEDDIDLSVVTSDDVSIEDDIEAESVADTEEEDIITSNDDNDED